MSITENEAIESLNGIYLEWCSEKEEYEMAQIAIKALEEIQQYKAIGTVEECQTAVEKMKPKKPIFDGDGYWNGQLVYDTWICPNCEKHYEMEYEEYDYCPNCGQAIDWSNEQ